MSMFRSNTRVIQTGGDGINRCDLTILILAEIRLHTVENTKFSGCNRCCSLSSIDTASSCLTTNQANSLVLNKVVESSDCIGTTANTGKYSIRKFSFFFQNLFFDLLGNNCLEITNNCRKWVRSHDRSEHIMCIGNTVCPLSHRLRNGIFQGCSSRCNGMYFGSQKAHSVYVQCLTFGIFFTHEDFTFHAHKSGCCRCRNTVLSGSGLCDNTRFSHLFGK